MSNYTPKALYHAVENAAANLPRGWEIDLTLSRQGWAVSLYEPSGESVNFESHGVIEDLIEAVNVANKKARD